ncbi:MAG: phage tail tube protein [Aaplasma endosymbiont of Hyalomma asiaticum]
MAIVKFKNKNGKHQTLTNTKSIRLSLHNQNTLSNSISSDSWQNSLAQAGNKYMSVKIIGVCDAGIESIVLDFAFENIPVSCEIIFSKSAYEKVEGKFFIELYERHLDAGNVENYTLILVSSGPIQHKFAEPRRHS